METSNAYRDDRIQDKIMKVIYTWRGSRRLVVLIVAIGLLLDNMLLTSVVPIIPTFLYEIHHEETLAMLNASTQTSSTAISPTIKEELPYLIPSHQESSDTNRPSEGDSSSSRGSNFKCTCPDAGKTQLESKDKSVRENAASIGTNYTSTTTLTPEKREQELKHKDLIEESTEVGILFASKPVVQAITNPFIGPLTNRIGYSIPMFAGFIILFISTLTFAAGKSSLTLFLARVLQGVGSSCTSVAGMGMLADRFTEDRERGNAMAIALGGLALGVLIGPPFGGIMYEFVGRASPFLALAVLALFDGLLQLFVLQPKVTPEPQEGASFLTLIKDPYVIVAAGAITFANTGIGILEPSLPLWMMDTMNSENWEQGAAFLPASISYLIGTNIFGPLGHKMGRWLAAMIGLIAIGFALISIPMARSLDQLIIPNGIIGFAIGMVDSSMMPMLGYLVDIRHTSTYGNVYAIGDVALCIGFIIGPLLSGTVVRWLGFEGLVTITAFICFIFAPFLFLLRKPPNLNESQTLLSDATIKYVNYTNEMSPEEEPATRKNGDLPLVP